MIYGIDTSHWEGVIDWQKVKNTAVKFAIHKATEGPTYVDTQFVANKVGCQEVGMPWGAYHFFRANYDPIIQADNFVNAVGTGCYVYVADAEIGGTNYANLLKAFVDRVQARTGNRPMIYTAYYFWHDNVGNDPYFKDFDLWVANYGVDTPMIPLPWTSYKIWQFSDYGRVDGINAAVDENWFNGDIQAVFDYFQNGIVVPPAPSMFIVKTTANLNIRAAPMGTVTGLAPLGTLLGVDGEVMYNGVKWYQIGTGYVSSAYCVKV